MYIIVITSPEKIITILISKRHDQRLGLDEPSKIQKDLNRSMFVPIRVLAEDRLWLSSIGRAEEKSLPCEGDITHVMR